MQTLRIEVGVSNVDICTHFLAISNREPNQAMSLCQNPTPRQPRDTYKYPSKANMPEMPLVAATPMVSTEGIISADTGASNSDRKALIL